MAIPSFFYDGSLAVADKIALSANESNHAVSARRLKAGQLVNIINGCGQIAEAQLTEATRKQVIVEVQACVEQAKTKPSINIITAVPKSDRQKFMVDMATQLGVNSFVPLESEYSVTSANSKTIERWNRYAIEACKQSKNAWKPTIEEPLSLANIRDWLPDLVAQGVVYYANGDGKCLIDIKNQLQTATAVYIIIGPEGGFSDQELQQFKQHKLVAIGLGRHILRTETAAVAAVAQVGAMLSD